MTPPPPPLQPAATMSSPSSSCWCCCFDGGRRLSLLLTRRLSQREAASPSSLPDPASGMTEWLGVPGLTATTTQKVTQGGNGHGEKRMPRRRGGGPIGDDQGRKSPCRTVVWAVE
ncbi:hypothetical protein E2562_039361 [Oryza meyeriana var. granulata]|uniref:Uncharacterized protein n=1 Tax=Oryza meyeriana var. granulata TaxID=110450 RepID=A0A6G1E7Z7_9ORYZ|nr:hypothetical protein E2562_039361 [Oryza meyeriana var. granulata]